MTEWFESNYFLVRARHSGRYGVTVDYIGPGTSLGSLSQSEELYEQIKSREPITGYSLMEGERFSPSPTALF